MNFDTYVVDTFEALQDLFAYAKQFNAPVVLDVETDHVQERLAKLHGIGLCFKDDEAFYIPIRKQDRSLCWSDAELSALSTGLHGIIKQLGWIAHNGVYDSLVIEYNFGYDISQLLHTDTILLKHTVDEERPFGLKEVAVKYLGPWADKAQDAMKESIKANGGSCTKENMEMYKADIDVLAEYCMYDVILTRKLYNLFLPMLKKEGLEKFFYEEEVMPLYREVTIDMKRQGIKIDVPYFEKLQKEVTEDMRILEASIMDSIRDDVAEFEQRLLNKDYPISRKGMFPKLLADELGVVLPVGKTGTVTLSKAAVEKATKEAGDENSALFFEWLNGNDCMSSKLLRRVQFKRFQKDNDRPHVFNLKSGDHLAHLIFEVYGEIPLGTTETGKPQVDDELLESLKDRYEWIAKLVEYKKLLKLSSTYIDGVLDRHVDSIIYTSFLQFGTTSGRFSSTNPNCLSMDTQVLTHTGFKTFHNIAPSDKVAVYDGTNLKWEIPEQKWKSEHKLHSMVSMKNEHADFLVTENHRMVYRNKKTYDITIKAANESAMDMYILHGAESNSQELPIGDDWLRFLVATQADAEICQYGGSIRFCFVKERKYTRLVEMATRLGLEIKTSIKMSRSLGKLRYEVRVYGIKEEVIRILGKPKKFPSEWLMLSHRQRNIILEEIFYWDGNFTRKVNYSCSVEDNVDFIQALCALNGWRGHKRIYYSRPGANPNYQIDITRRDYSLTTNIKVENKEEVCEVWCLKVSTGMFLVRRGSDTFITGNCQNLPKTKGEDSNLSPLVLKYTNSIRAGFVTRKGKKFIDNDYIALEPKCFAHMSGSPDLKDIFIRGEDMYSSIAIKTFREDSASAFKRDPNFLGKIKPELRSKSKVFCLATVYGAEAGRIAELMGVTREEAQEIIDAYLGAYPELKSYIKDSHESAKKLGYVQTIFGRKRHLPEVKALYETYGDKLLDYRFVNRNGLKDQRRKYKNGLNNATNMRIQGLASHIINRAMIAINREFKNKKLNGNIVLQVHDQLVIECDENIADKVKKIVQDCMENTVTISVPLVAEPQIANNLKDSH